jgi:hypothetical protein
MQWLRYCSTITMGTVFSMWRGYKQESVTLRFSCWLKLAAVQLSEVRWSSWLVRVQLRVSLWREGYEIGVKWPPAWDPVTWVVSWEAVLQGRLWQEDLSAGSWRISIVRSRCYETASGDCDRLRTLACVFQWSVNCSSEWRIQVVNKIQYPIHTLSIVTQP